METFSCVTVCCTFQSFDYYIGLLLSCESIFIEQCLFPEQDILEISDQEVNSSGGLLNADDEHSLGDNILAIRSELLLNSEGNCRSRVGFSHFHGFIYFSFLFCNCRMQHTNATYSHHIRHLLSFLFF